MGAGLCKANGVVAITTLRIVIDTSKRNGVVACKALNQSGLQAGGVQCVVNGVAGEGRRGHRGKR